VFGLDDGEELVGLLPVVDAADFGDDEAVDVFDGPLLGVGDVEHVLKALIAGRGAVAVPHHPRVDLAGEVGAVFGDHVDDILCALVAHRGRSRVLVVWDPDVRSAHAAESGGASKHLCGVVFALDRGG
jgi:hypothetical protein